MDDHSAELSGQTIFDENPEWTIEPIGIGWSATRTTNQGATIHTVCAPTITELRQKLREIRDRTARR